MEKKRVVPIWLSVIYTLLCAGAIVCEGIGLIRNTIGIIGTITYIMEIVTTVLAACYCFTGYKKSSSGIFKAVIISMLITTVLILSYLVSMQFYVQFYAELVIFGCLCIFAVAKDIGERRSLILAGLMLIASIIPTVYFLNLCGWTTSVSAYLTDLLISIIILLMVIAKYKDKAARGTK